jgi:hypothetical protein
VRAQQGARRDDLHRPARARQPGGRWQRTVSFTCPAARDAVETGGEVALFTGAAFPDDATAAVTCTVVP